MFLRLLQLIEAILRVIPCISHMFIYLKQFFALAMCFFVDVACNMADIIHYSLNLVDLILSLRYYLTHVIGLCDYLHTVQIEYKWRHILTFLTFTTLWTYYCCQKSHHLSNWFIYKFKFKVLWAFLLMEILLFVLCQFYVPHFFLSDLYRYVLKLIS